MNKILLIVSLVLMFTACKQKEATTVTKEAELTKVEIRACTKDAKQCPDGRTVGRDPNNQCEFFTCKTKKKLRKKKATNKFGNEVMCTADVKECPDGSYVGRDHSNKCKFKECPTSKPKI